MPTAVLWVRGPSGPLPPKAARQTRREAATTIGAMRSNYRNRLQQYHSLVAELTARLGDDDAALAGVIRRAPPVPAFGRLLHSSVATVGLNPSNLEFVDRRGAELQGKRARFETLQSLGLDSWLDADAGHLKRVIAACDDYFLRNPYDRWFRRLDEVVSGTGASYYRAGRTACHLDIVPYATHKKWSSLGPRRRQVLLRLGGDSLAELLRLSSVDVLVLNGSSVRRRFVGSTGVALAKRVMPGWSLPRRSGREVVGSAYEGVLESVEDVDLGRQILVLGFNHNIQSSFGVTKEVIHKIRAWVERETTRFRAT